mmetsp:Transcript_12063/g.27339  ORF Transcript_12063/g.27339 Transcript_12063/m.27339 type:complete len:313 (-) Transcript_12063:1306-2244(-)
MTNVLSWSRRRSPSFGSIDLMAGAAAAAASFLYAFSAPGSSTASPSPSLRGRSRRTSRATTPSSPTSGFVAGSHSPSARFCIVHSSRPANSSLSSPLAASVHFAFLFRLIIIPGRLATPSRLRTSRTAGMATYSTLVFAGNFDTARPLSSTDPSSRLSSSRPYLSNSVYSTLLTPYVYPPGAFFSTRTFMPSFAPTARGHDANPKLFPCRAPYPANESSVVSVPAMGFDTCLTTTAWRFCASSHVRTPSSCRSFHSAPCPPGLSCSWNALPSTIHLPSVPQTSGTLGCFTSRKLDLGRPKNALSSMRREMRL